MVRFELTMPYTALDLQSSDQPLINILLSYHLKSKQQYREKAKRHQQSVNRRLQLQNQSDAQLYSGSITFLSSKRQEQRFQRKRGNREIQWPCKTLNRKYHH